MAKFSALKKEALRRINDISGAKITTAVMGDFINNALEDWATSVEPMLYTYGWAVTAKQFRYDLPDNWMKPKTVHWYQNGEYPVQYMSPKDFQRRGYMDWDQTSTTPQAYTIIDRDLWLGPPPSTTGNTSAMNDAGGISATDTSVIATDGTKFRTNSGVVKIEDELIMYQNVSTNTLQLLIRAQGGTTAATHADATTISRCDLVATYFAVPAALSATTDAPVIETRWHKTLLYSAIAQALNALGREDEAMQQMQIYEAKKVEAKREVRRAQRDEYFSIYSPYSP